MNNCVDLIGQLTVFHQVMLYEIHVVETCPRSSWVALSCNVRSLAELRLDFFRVLATDLG